MQPRRLDRGEIVQLQPGARNFGGCLMVVTEAAPWGAKGYVMLPGLNGRSDLRFPFEEMEETGGRAFWVDAD